MAKKLETIGKSSTGMDENIGALVANLFGWVSGIIMFLIEKESKFVKFHGLQSFIVFLGLILVGGLLGQLPLIGGLISWAASTAGLVLWIILMIKSYQGEWFEIPYISDFVKAQIGE